MHRHRFEVDMFNIYGPLRILSLIGQCHWNFFKLAKNNKFPTQGEKGCARMIVPHLKTRFEIFFPKIYFFDIWSYDQQT